MFGQVIVTLSEKFTVIGVFTPGSPGLVPPSSGEVEITEGAMLSKVALTILDFKESPLSLYEIM